MSQHSREKRIKHPKGKSTGFLTAKQVQILQKQISANSSVIDRYIYVIDLLANKERCPKDANTLLDLRKRLAIAFAENDTFRKVLWRYAQRFERSSFQDGSLDAASFLVERIKSRKRAILAQMAMK